jgi:hypothetical protein
LGTRLASLVPAEEWTHDFIVEREISDREPPDFS